MDSRKESDSKENDYVKRKENFTTKLLAFHRARGNPIRRFPLLGGRELDLYHLYTKVQEMGGSEVVTKERNWGEVSRSFSLPSTVTSGSYSCRLNYSKYLLEYEQYELSSNNTATIKTSSMDSDQSSFTLSTPMPVCPPQTSAIPNSASLSQSPLSILSVHLSNLLSLPGLQGLGNLLDQLCRVPNQLQTLSNMLNLPPNQVQLLELLMQQRQKQLQLSQAPTSTRYDWLIRSLQSGFPNEVDFTLNVLLIMSFDDKPVICLNKVPQLVDVLLAHVGVFAEGDMCLEELYHEWHANDDLDYHRMWEESVPAHVYSLLLDPLQQAPDQFNKLFPLRSILSEDYIESFRVSQVSMIIRNLSFDEINGKFLASHKAMLRFLLLGINCSLPMISNHCLDILTAITPHLSLNELGDYFNESSIAFLLMSSLQELVLSDDRQCILKAVECIGALAYAPGNIGALCQLSHDVISRIFQCLLLVEDIQLILTCLDTLYCLTFLGNSVARIVLDCNYHSVNTLVDLLTLNYKDSPPLDIIGQLSLLHPDGKEEPVTMTTDTLINEPIKEQQQADLSTSLQTNVSKPSHSNVKTTTPQVTTTTSSDTRTPHRQPKEQKVKLKKLFSTIDSSKLSFGKQWLQVFYKENPDEFVSKSEMYSQYLSSCAHLKVKTAATQTEFDCILKETFPRVSFTNVKLSGQDIQLVGGVTKNPLPSTGNPQQPVSKQDTISTGSSSTLTPSRSPSPAPAPALSPLQQLIQQTKSKAANPIPKASPLLVSSKMSDPSSVNENTGQLKDSRNILNSKLLNGVCKPMVNGDMSEKERNELRKRSLDGLDSYTIPRVKQAKLTNTHDNPPTCIPPPSSSTTPVVSNSAPSPTIDTSTRASSLPPHFTTSNNTSSLSSSKARSLTPPSSIAPSTAELLLDTLKLVQPVKSKSTNSLPEPLASINSVQGPTGLICLWNNCLKIKNSPSDLFSHVVYDHVSVSPQPVHTVCQWSGCTSKAKRMLPSLLRHVQAHHCSGLYSTVNRPTPPNAAQTLMRLRTVPKWEVDEESSIGKTVHLTAALVLRNLLETVPHAKMRLSQYEPVLTQVALSSCEASGTAAQCLYLLTSQDNSSSSCSTP